MNQILGDNQSHTVDSNQKKDNEQPTPLLVVDDSKTMRLVVRTYLEELGFTDFVEADDGFQALESFKTHSPNLVFLDAHLPTMDGDAVAEAMLKMNPYVKIVVVSAEEENSETVKKMRRMGTFAYLKKPLKKVDLENMSDELKKAVFGVHSKVAKISSAISGPVLVEYTDYDELVETGFLSLVCEKYRDIYLFSQKGSTVHNAVGRLTSETEQMVIQEGEFSSIREGGISAIFQRFGNNSLIVFDSITESMFLLGFTDTYKLLREVMKQLSTYHFTSIFLLNRSAHEPKELVAIRSVFAKRVDVNTGEIHGLVNIPAVDDKKSDATEKHN